MAEMRLLEGQREEQRVAEANWAAGGTARKETQSEAVLGRRPMSDIL